MIGLAMPPGHGCDVPGGRPRRRLLLALALAPAVAAAADVPSIAVLDFELIDDQHELAPAGPEYQRLAVITRQLRTELQSRGWYRVVDTSAVQPMIDRLRAHQNLRECNGCELDIARALKADRVLVGWVQKVSNLILNINIRIEDVSSGAVVLQKSVDIRSNTDESWRRGIDAILRDMQDRGQGGR
jgi:Protein of unknown function (DUF2380)